MSLERRIELATRLIDNPQVAEAMQTVIDQLVSMFKSLPIVFAPTDAQWERLRTGFVGSFRADLARAPTPSR